MHGGRDYRLPSRFLRELPRDVLAQAPGARRSAPAGGTWASAAAAAGGASSRDRAPSLASGDAVLHATFGEGVVIAIERGGELVRVRFTQDGTERRLMAGAAPMRKVS
jgi:DNA helicase-2/ATP-dependent DNA helicase PcrA